MLKCPHCSAVLKWDLALVEPPQKDFVPRGAGGRFGLTPSEVKAVDMVVDGLGNSDIAKELGVTMQVVKNRLWAAYLKIGCRNRAEMVSMVLLGTDKPR